KNEKNERTKERKERKNERTKRAKERKRLRRPARDRQWMYKCPGPRVKVKVLVTYPTTVVPLSRHFHLSPTLSATMSENTNSSARKDASNVPPPSSLPAALSMQLQPPLPAVPPPPTAATPIIEQSAPAWMLASMQQMY